MREGQRKKKEEIRNKLREDAPESTGLCTLRVIASGKEGGREIVRLTIKSISE